MSDKLLVLTTAASAAEARSLAHGLVSERLAACVNVVPGVASIYYWQGAIEESGEVLVVIKTSRDLFSAVRAHIEHAHSYDLPEVVAVAIEDGSERYLEWLSAGLRGPLS